MSPLPTQMRDRWRNRADIEPGHGRIYWHVLLHDDPVALDTAKTAQHRLSAFPGLHLTPEKWLHLTTLLVGPTADISADQITAMLHHGTQTLSGIQPIPVTLGRVLYHPEAIMLAVQPERALDKILNAVQTATRTATGKEGTINGTPTTWTPHITIAYSTADQPTAPITRKLGKQLPTRSTTIKTVSLVIQWGPERLWNWERVGTIQLGANSPSLRR